MSKPRPNDQPTLTKSRFKFIIDQIQRKLYQPDPPVDHQKSYISTSSFHCFKRNRILPKYVHTPVPQAVDTTNEKNISVNLEFNKLLMQEKKKFLEHSPNDKDLILNLPDIKIDSDKNDKKHKNHKSTLATQTSPRWKLKPLVMDKTMLVTEPKFQGFLKYSKKWTNMDWSVDRQNEDIQRYLKLNFKGKENRKFREIRKLNESSGKIERSGRYSHKEKRGETNKRRHKLKVLTHKESIRLQVKPHTSKTILSRMKIKVLNLDRMKIAQNQLDTQ